MQPVASGDDLLAFALQHQARGGRGFLLSGGCDARGRVPIKPFLRAVREVKRRTRLLVNIHTGLLDRREEAEELGASGADALSVDLVQDPRVIKQVMHLDREPEDYRRTLGHLCSSGAKQVVPHLCIGVPGGSVASEEAALRLLSEFPISAVVLLAFLPAKGTPLAGSGPVPSERIVHVAMMALRELRVPILLGCMRSRGDWTMEVELIRSGLAGVAMPSPRTVSWAEDTGREVEWREECCALHR